MWLEVVLYAFVGMVIIVTIGRVFVPTILDIVRQFRNNRGASQDSETLQEEIEKMLRSPPDSVLIDEEIREIQEELERSTNKQPVGKDMVSFSAQTTVRKDKEKQ